MPKKMIVALLGLCAFAAVDGYSESLNVTGTGVGIGVASPQKALEVAGQGEFSGGLKSLDYTAEDPTYLPRTVSLYPWGLISEGGGFVFEQRTNEIVAFNTGAPGTDSYQTNMMLIPYHYQGGQNQQATVVVGTFSNYSDRKLKSNIEDLPPTEMGRVMRLRPTSYTGKGSEGGKRHYGFIAQELEEVYPSMVHDFPDPLNEGQTTKAVAYLELIAPLVKVVQEQQVQIVELQKVVSEQNQRLAALEGR